MALYPGHMLENTTKDFQLNPYVPVTTQTPPMFLLQAENDSIDSVKNSLVYYSGLKKAGVPCGDASVCRRRPCLRTSAHKVSHNGMASVGGDMVVYHRHDLAAMKCPDFVSGSDMKGS